MGAQRLGQGRADTEEGRRQRDYEARRREAAQRLDESEIVATRAELEAVRDKLFVLRCAVDDVGRHPADDMRSDEAVAKMTAEIQAAVKERKGSVQSPKQVVIVDAVPVTAPCIPPPRALPRNSRAPRPCSRARHSCWRGSSTRTS